MVAEAENLGFVDVGVVGFEQDSSVERETVENDAVGQLVTVFLHLPESRL